MLRFIAFLTILCSHVLFSQQQTITLNDLFGPDNTPVSKSQFEDDKPLKFYKYQTQIQGTSNKLRRLDIFNPDDENTTRQIPNASKMYKKNSQSVVLLIGPDGQAIGSGCIIDEKGYLVTNWHVIEGEEDMFVFYYSSEHSSIEDLIDAKYSYAKILAADKSKDLAYLKISDTRKYESLSIGTSKEINIAEDVFAIGHPESLLWSFTYGVISQIRNNYKWEYSDGSSFSAKIIQTQTPINPGNSGGPLFSSKGRLIGINSFTSSNSEGLNFAIHIDEINGFVNDVKDGKHKYVYKKKEEEEYEWEEYDNDNNGIVDMKALDIDGDGTYDLISIDENEDDIIDYFMMDLNSDGHIDTKIYDKNSDGQYEYFLMDTNFDRHYDTVGIDDDSDNLPDRYYDY